MPSTGTLAEHRPLPYPCRRLVRRPAWARTRWSGTAERHSDWLRSTHWNYRTPLRPPSPMRMRPSRVPEEPCGNRCTTVASFSAFPTSGHRGRFTCRVHPSSPAYGSYSDAVARAEVVCRLHALAASSTARLVRHDGRTLGEAFLLDAFGVTQRGAVAVREPDGFILRHGHVHAGRGVTDGLG